MRILVTGGLGFIGRVVCRQLRALGMHVTVVDMLLPQVHGTQLPPPPDEICDRFIHNRVSALGPLPACDVIIHLAAHVGVGQSMYAPTDYALYNVHDTCALWERIISAERRPERVVVASSMSVYGEGLYGRGYGGGLTRDPRRHNWDRMVEAPHPEPASTPEIKRPEPASIYALTKLDQERYSLLLGRTYEVPTTALRFFNCYGPGQAPSNPYTGAIAMFGCRILNSKAPQLFEDGQQRRDFIYVEDLADAIVSAALDLTERSGLYNVGTGIGTTLETVADYLAQAVPWCPTPQILRRYRKGDVRHCWADMTRFCTAYPEWEPKVGLARGLPLTMEWMAGLPAGALVDRTDEALAELERQGLVVEVPEG